MRRLLCLCLSAWCLMNPAFAQARPPPSSMDTLQDFYRWVLAQPGTGIPTPKQRRQLTPLVSPRLIQLFKDAAETEARCIKTAPNDEKPLLLEGSLFVSNDGGGATEAAYGPTRMLDDGTASTTMHLFHVDKRFGKGTMFRTIAWTDEVRLRQEGGRWLVQDLLFGQSRSLVHALEAYIEEGAGHCIAPARH